MLKKRGKGKEVAVALFCLGGKKGQGKEKAGQFPLEAVAFLSAKKRKQKILSSGGKEKSREKGGARPQASLYWECVGRKKRVCRKELKKRKGGQTFKRGNGPAADFQGKKE